MTWPLDSMPYGVELHLMYNSYQTASREVSDCSHQWVNEALVAVSIIDTYMPPIHRGWNLRRISVHAIMTVL